MKKYGVDFYDMFDGWIHMPDSEFDWQGKPMQFDKLEDAKAEADRLYAELDEDNKKAGEHYGVIDLEQGREVYCCQGGQKAALGQLSDLLRSMILENR